MPTFPTDSVHGLSADVYFAGTPVRVFGEITLNIAPETLPLTANDEGAFNPVAILRRGESVTIGVPVADTTGLPVMSGVTMPFASGLTTSGALSGAIVLPKSVPGDNYLDHAEKLVLVTRDGSATFVFPAAVCVALDELTMFEDAQMVWGATFQAFNTTVSGVETPFYVLSGSHPPA